MQLEILSEERRILSLASRDKLTGCLSGGYLYLPHILKNIGSARSPAVDNGTLLSSLRLWIRQ